MHTYYLCIALLLFVSFELGHSESLNDSFSDIYQTSDDDYNSGIVIDSVLIDSENNNRRIKRKDSVTPKTPPKYCANNGTYEYGRCRCKYPYTGPKCFDFACGYLRIKRKDSVTPKTPPKYCANNGTYEYGRCRCKYPYTGPKCFDFACEHGLSVGARYDPESPIWSKRCLCDDDWSGDLCNIPIADQCNGRGQYINGHCRCLDYYFGSRCQYVGKCEHGKLIEGICKCEYGWEGDYCSKIVCHHGYT
uniref:EGF-like domain-containing protein n=1 Tax=Panagrolaimus sp. PS1159 TaxID=55785 RepID=A0AC35F5Y4_9BILA